VKTILPGAAIEVLGAGENRRLFMAAATRMGYRLVDTVVTESVPAAKAVGEIAVVAARCEDGEFASYAPIALNYVDGILDIARSPAPIDSRLAKRVAADTRALFEDRKLIGVGCAEFSFNDEHQLVLRELTPRAHPAGYLTLVSSATDMFEQQIRAVCGLPLGSTKMLSASAMATFSASENEPDYAAALAFPGVKLYLYDDRRGHLIATARSATLAKQIVQAASKAL
jgi:5-(carboxyamino)imidazole ribonucleotide synthase